jgi:hypothetical protein
MWQPHAASACLSPAVPNEILTASKRFQVTDPEDFSRLLSARREGPRRRRAGCQRGHSALAWTVSQKSDSPRPDCMAGDVRLELRNVVTKYSFERSQRFRQIQPNSGDRDYSRLSCGAWETPLGNATISADMTCSLAEMAEIADFGGSKDDAAPIEQRHCLLCAGLSADRERV